jgi:hypothetical protein
MSPPRVQPAPVQPPPSASTSDPPPPASTRSSSSTGAPPAKDAGDRYERSGTPPTSSTSAVAPGVDLRLPDNAPRCTTPFCANDAQAAQSSQPKNWRNYGGLSSSVRDAVDGANDRTRLLHGSPALRSMIESDGFKSAGPANQLAMLRALDPPSQGTSDNLTRIVGSAGFRGLSPTEQQLTINRSRKLDSSRLIRATPDQLRQATQDATAKSGESIGFDAGRDNLPELPDSRRRPATVGAAADRNVAFAQEGQGPNPPRAAEVSTVQIGGKSVEVVVPKSIPAADRPRLLDMTVKSLRAMPEPALKELHAVYLKDGAPPQPGDEAGTTGANRYGEPLDISVYVDSLRGQKDLDQRMLHESGHIVSANLKNGYDYGSGRITMGPNAGKFPPGTGWAAWDAAMAKDNLRVSTYAGKDEREDLAETWRLYQTVKGTPDEPRMRALFPERWKLLGQIR